jgi:ankyrin repeat protein
MSDAPEVSPSPADLKQFQKVLPNLSPLARAVYDGDSVALQHLVRLGAKFDEVRPNLPPPLTVAVGLRRQEMVTFLLDCGADPNVHDGALLPFAVSRKDLDSLRALLDHGATLGKGLALVSAARGGLIEAVDLLIERGAPLEEAGGDGFTPVLMAALEGHSSIVARLIAAGANLEAVSQRGQTAISMAAGNGHVEIVRALADAGATLESAGEAWTPLATAAGGGHVATVTELLRRGADPNGRSQKMWTPLIIATYSGRVETLRQLLSAGAEPDRRDGRGRTALMWASWRQFRRCYDILLAAGADPTLEASEGTSPRSAPSIAPMRRSGGIPREGFFIRLLSRVMVWGGKKQVIQGIPVTVADIDGKEAVAFSVVEKALRLLEKHAPSELGRIRRAFTRIIVTELPFFKAAYANTHRWCLVNWDPKKPALSPSEVAALLAHEATHYRLSRFGFGYREAERVRVERACSRAALRISRHLPGREAGVAVSRDHLHWIAPDGLSDVRQREAGIAALKKQGMPGWLLRVFDWIARRVQRKRERS